MKTLLLMRHAKSSWDDPDLTDSERPLNHRGQRDAPLMGKLLRKRNLIPDRIVTSPAVRARMTADLVAAECGRSKDVTEIPDLYHADVVDWQTVVEQFSPKWNTVLCIGHNPELEEYLASVAGRYVRMPTAAIACLTCDAPHWREFARGTEVVLLDVWRPKDRK